VEGFGTVGEEKWIGEVIEIGRAGENAVSFFLPTFCVASIADFGFDSGNSLQQELAIVSEGDGVLAGDASGDLVNENFSESDIDGSSGLKITDGGKNIRGDEVAVSDATHFLIEVMMAKRSVARIVGGGTAFAVGAKMLTTTIGCGLIGLSSCSVDGRVGGRRYSNSWRGRMSRVYDFGFARLR